jgi:hypothetical protein
MNFAQEESKENLNQNNNTNSNSRIVRELTQFNVISSKEIKSLDVLNHQNICSCEDFIRSTNATRETLPLISWMNYDTQFIIEQKMKNHAIEDYGSWKNKPYLEWLFPVLKQLYPDRNQLIFSDSIFDRISTLKPIFYAADLNNEKLLDKLIRKLLEISRNYEIQAADENKHKAIISKLLETMAPNENSSSSGNLTAIRMKQLVKQLNPQNMDEFIRYYMDEFYKNQVNFNMMKAFIEIPNTKKDKKNVSSDSNQQQQEQNKSNFNKNFNKNKFNNKNKNKSYNNNKIDVNNNSSTVQQCKGCGRTIILENKRPAVKNRVFTFPVVLKKYNK